MEPKDLTTTAVGARTSKFNVSFCTAVASFVKLNAEIIYGLEQRLSMQLKNHSLGKGSLRQKQNKNIKLVNLLFGKLGAKKGTGKSLSLIFKIIINTATASES